MVYRPYQRVGWGELMRDADWTVLYTTSVGVIRPLLEGSRGAIHRPMTLIVGRGLEHAGRSARAINSRVRRRSLMKMHRGAELLPSSMNACVRIRERTRPVSSAGAHQPPLASPQSDGLN